MPQPPTEGDIREIAARYGIRFSDAEVTAFSAAVASSVRGYERLDEFTDEPLPPRYPRDAGRPPVPEANPSNGWVWRCSIGGASEGPLAGVRVAIKDNICLAGMPFLNGSPVMEGFVPREDATVVTRLLDAGGQIVGKTAVPSFSFDGGGLTGYPDPQPVNPHDPTRLAGGSSNGSAVVVVTGQADLALGGDQGGSVRLPASWSGCCGLKPTYGLVPYTGIFPIERTLDSVGPLARTARECAAALQVLAGPDGLDPRQPERVPQDYLGALDAGLDGLRIGILEEGLGLEVSEPDVDALVRQAAADLASGGAEVASVSVPMHRDGLAIWSAIAIEGSTELMVQGDAFGTSWSGHHSTDLIDFYSQARRARANDFSDIVKLTVIVGHYMADRYGHHYYAKAQNLARTLRSAYDAALEPFDVLVLPTTAMKAKPIPGPGASLEEVLGAALGNLQNTAPFNATGHPALSVPCGLSDGLPVGLMIVGRRFDDATVLRVGHAFQEHSRATSGR